VWGVGSANHSVEALLTASPAMRSALALPYAGRSAG
jgi:hypothetical protein